MGAIATIIALITIPLYMILSVKDSIEVLRRTKNNYNNAREIDSDYYYNGAGKCVHRITGKLISVHSAIGNDNSLVYYFTDKKGFIIGGEDGHLKNDGTREKYSRAEIIAYLEKNGYEWAIK